MSPIANRSAIYNSTPIGYPVLNETVTLGSSTIDLESVALGGGILIKSLWLSIDPYLRERMRDPSVKSYAPGYQLGKPIWGFAVVQVLRSEVEGVKAGDFLRVAECPFQEYNVLPPEHPVTVIKEEEGVPLSLYVGLLGMPGQTAFYGLEVVGKPVKGETIFVSSGASAVGSLVAQLSKAKGLKVIASAGSDEKVAFMKSIGVDVAFNYKTESTADVLAKEGPIDIYWDNVGGPTLDAALGAFVPGGRVIVCGTMSEYNTKEAYGVKNTPQILLKRLRVEGFYWFLAGETYEGQKNKPERFMQAMVPLIKSGQLKWSEQVYNGIETVGEAIVAVQTGTATAKVVVKVGDL
ncbi:hypothetical protein RSOLAG22IIIB_07466 [Rhizoctonia solani]|uniref:Enoyl reductase (ER) domain-containing protein n=1 Tax=Rhizoctonia solani TaxID=456999 RepID=A0A0K6FN62_9AGAM|nr:hypothetical protein RSOLAG22IIIB_07466 [Rhizoctonia solani]